MTISLLLDSQSLDLASKHLKFEPYKLQCDRIIGVTCLDLLGLLFFFLWFLVGYYDDDDVL